MSTIIVATLVNLLTLVLPLVGIEYGSEQLTSFVQTLVGIATGIYIYIARVRQGDVTKLGFRK